MGPKTLSPPELGDLNSFIVKRSFRLPENYAMSFFGLKS
jgi:hypothetical protein